MMGGYGYSSEYDMERLVRSTLVSTIYGGTSEIQRNIIAKTLGLWRPTSPHRLQAFDALAAVGVGGDRRALHVHRRTAPARPPIRPL